MTTRLGGTLAVTVVLAVAAGCATPAANPSLSLRTEKGWNTMDVEAAIRRAAAGDVAVVNLGNTAWVSHHVVVVRTEEKPHYHRFHDLTLTVLRGEGVLQVEQRKVPVKAGDVVHIHRGTPHFFRNTGSQPGVAFVVFSPPFDGRDTIAAEAETKPEPPPVKKDWWWPF